jgi:glycosyltransferase involved in cell wall biosynthesis
MKEEYGHQDVVVVPNGVDWEQFGGASRERPNYPTVGMMYSRNPIKGASDGLTALRQAQITLPKLRVVLLAQEPVRGHRLPRNATVHMRPAHGVLKRVYEHVSCWLLPSHTEGFGMPALEAAACWRPVVATDCGGPRDIVEDGVNGRLVPVGDTAAMADAALDILQMDEAGWRRMSDASHRIAQRFNWDRSAAILESALLEALDSDRGPAVSVAESATS